MQIPIDVAAVLREATNVEAARAVPLSVSVLLDETAPADLTAFVRSSFASASAQARVSINYFSDGQALFDPRSDMAVIAAGLTYETGLVAEQVRAAGIPVMVVTTLPTLVADIAAEMGCPIPEADLIAPEVRDGDVVMFAEPISVASGSRGAVSSAGEGAPSAQLAILSGSDPSALEPLALTQELAARLSLDMGEWIVAAFRQKRLAFAQAFPFVRKPLALESVSATAVQNAGVGLVVFIPGADMPIMTLNQAKMLLQIAAAYGQPLGPERVKELACIVGGGFAFRAIARQAAGIVPALGWAVKAAVGYTGTVAMGRAAVEYFEHGGTVSGLAAAACEARDKAVAAAEGTAVGRGVKEAASVAASEVRHAASAAAAQAVHEAPSKIAGLARGAARIGGRAVSAAMDAAVRK